MSAIARFIDWAATAPSAVRAEATTALVRAYLTADLSAADRQSAEQAMSALLHDPVPSVRRALAAALADAPQAPRGIVLALALDATDIAEIVLSRSAVFRDAELVDLVALGERRLQTAIAARAVVSAGLAAAIAEVGARSACACLLRNPGARLTDGALSRLADRLGDDAEVRSLLLDRTDLPGAVRHELARRLAEALGAFVTRKGWLTPERARRTADEARARTALMIAERGGDGRLAGFVRHLIAAGDLNAALLLRAAFSGQMSFLAEAVAQLAGIDSARAARLLAAPRAFGFAALYRRTGLPAATYDSFVLALESGMRAAGVESASRMLSADLVSRASRLLGSEPGTPELGAFIGRLEAEAQRDGAPVPLGDLRLRGSLAA